MKVVDISLTYIKFKTITIGDLKPNLNWLILILRKGDASFLQLITSTIIFKIWCL